MTAKAALIIAVTLIVCTGLYIYFSPYPHLAVLT